MGENLIITTGNWLCHIEIAWLVKLRCHSRAIKYQLPLMVLSTVPYESIWFNLAFPKPSGLVQSHRVNVTKLVYSSIFHMVSPSAPGVP